MMNEQREAFPPDVQAAIEQSFFAERRPAKEVTIERGDVTLNVRTNGALIQNLRVGKQSLLVSASTATSRPRNPDSFLQPVKTDGTITMLPAGLSEVGPQHGVSRYLDYAIWKSGSGELRLHAQDTLHALDHLKTFTLESDGLTLVDSVVNIGNKDTNLSIGEHYYFDASGDFLEQISFVNAINVDQIRTMRKKDGSVVTGPLYTFVDELDAGRALYWDEFTGHQRIWIGGVGHLQLEATASVHSTALPVGLLIWHRQGSDSICFEPVAGFSVDEQGQTHNQGIKLPPGQSLTLTSRVRLGQ